ncbi:MAG: methyltransferase domain-containing protein [Archaeoglobaceae archaeon]
MWNDVAESYRRWAEFNRWYYRSFALFISKYVQPKLIVDICCGPGVLSSELKNVFPNAEIVSVDSSTKMCKIARAIKADAHTLPFKNEIFDLAIFCFALHELEVQKAIQEAERVLKRGGTIAIADLNSKTPQIVRFFAEAFLTILISPEYAKNLALKWNAFLDRDQLASLLQNCGFKVIGTREFFDVWIVAKKI